MNYFLDDPHMQVLRTWCIVLSPPPIGPTWDPFSGKWTVVLTGASPFYSLWISMDPSLNFRSRYLSLNLQRQISLYLILQTNEDCSISLFRVLTRCLCLTGLTSAAKRRVGIVAGSICVCPFRYSTRFRVYHCCQEKGWHCGRIKLRLSFQVQYKVHQFTSAAKRRVGIALW